MSAYRIHVRPWVTAARALMPRRPVITSNVEAERTMNVLGFSVSVDRRPSSRTRWTRRAALLLAANGVIMAGGTAYAYWSTTGTGTGSASAGQAVSLSTVSASAASTGLLYPNGPAGDLKVTFENPNTFPVKITDLTAGAGSVTAAGGTGTCSTTGVNVSAKTNLTIVVPAKSGATNGTATETIGNAVSMAGTSDNGCQNATFTVPVSFTGVSN